MVPPVDLRMVVGSTVHAKSIHVMAEAECNVHYVPQKKVNIDEGVVINVDLQITKKRWKQSYFISDYKKTDVSVKRAMIHIKFVVAGPVIVPVLVNITATVPLLTPTTTTIPP